MNKKIGSTPIAKIKNQVDMNRFVKSLGLENKPLIIKPNWIAPRHGEYNDAKALELLFKAVQGPKKIVESYSFWRTKKQLESREDYFSSTEGTLKEGKKHWNHFKKQDKWFLEHSGISRILKKYKVDYINITNEYWSKRCVSSSKVKDLVGAKFSPIVRKELLSFVPQILFDMKGSQFLSFAHAKAYTDWEVTLSTKNLFGLIPAPTRWPLYHGDDDQDLSQNIVDINKIYRALFNCCFMVEGIFTVLKEFHKPNHEIVENWGVVVGGRNSAEVDNIATKLIGRDLSRAKIDPISKAEEEFGKFDHRILDKLPKKFFIS